MMLRHVLCVALLAGCQTVPERSLPGPVRVEVREIKVPVPIPCVSVSELPTVPKTSVPPEPTAGLLQITAGLLADLLALEQYALQADVLLQQCAQP